MKLNGLFFTSLEEFSTNVTIIRGNKWKNRRDFTMERKPHVWCLWFWFDLFVQRFSSFLLNYRCEITNNGLVFPPIVVFVLSFFLSTHRDFLDIVLNYLIYLLYFMASVLRLQEILGDEWSSYDTNGLYCLLKELWSVCLGRKVFVVHS